MAANKMTDGATERRDLISLLDVAVIAAENWLVLVFVPVLAGISIAAGLWVFTPSQYTSEAILRLTQTQVATVRSLPFQNGEIFDPVLMAEFGDSGAGTRTSFFRNQLSVTKITEPDIYSVVVRSNSPDSAYRLLAALIDSLVAESTEPADQQRPLESRRSELTRSLTVLDDSLRRLNRLVEAALLEQADATGDIIEAYGKSLASIIDAVEAQRQELSKIEEAMGQAIEPDAVLQWPSVSNTPLAISLVRPAVSGMLGVAFFVLMFVLIRAGLAGVRTPEGHAKLNRIRRAFWLKPRDAGLNDHHSR